MRPIYKKADRDQVKKYRPVRLLSDFSKAYEQFLHDSLSKFTDQILSKFISAYRKSNSSCHVPMRPIEDWKASLSNNKLVETVLIDLSKVFDYIPHDSLNRQSFNIYILLLKKKTTGSLFLPQDSLMKNLTNRWTQSEHFFLKLGCFFFQILKQAQNRIYWTKHKWQKVDRFY